MSDNAPAPVRPEWHTVYEHSPGEIAAEFLRAMREEGTIKGRRCSTCERVLVPGRSFCDRCFVRTDACVDVEPKGTIEAFTIALRAVKGLPDPPYALAYVLLKGADVALLNLVRGVDFADVRRAASALAIGTAVRAVFKPLDQREGRMTDFWYELESGRAAPATGGAVSLGVRYDPRNRAALPRRRSMVGA